MVHQPCCKTQSEFKHAWAQTARNVLFSFCWRWVEMCTWLGSTKKSPYYFRHANSLMCFTVLSYWDVKPFKFTLAPLSEVCVIKVKKHFKKVECTTLEICLAIRDGKFFLCTLHPVSYSLLSVWICFVYYSVTKNKLEFSWINSPGENCPELPLHCSTVSQNLLLDWKCLSTSYARCKSLRFQKGHFSPLCFIKYTHTTIRSHIYMLIHKHTLTHIHTQAHTCIHIHSHIRTLMNIYTHAHTHTQT